MAEPTLASVQGTIDILNKYEFKFKKKFGQNFLIDRNVLEKIVASALVSKDDFVIEIGPGIGTMTQFLAESAREVLAIEVDKNLIPVLQDTLSPWDNIEILNEDILKVDLSEIVKTRNKFRPVKVVANLPYYITTPIIMRLFETKVPLTSVTIMVQREVAERMKASPGTKDYGAFSLAVQYYADPKVVMVVPRSCFMPKPNVDSAVICLVRHNVPPVQVKDEKLFFKLIRVSFMQRRKTLLNSLRGRNEFSFNREDIEEILKKASLPLQIRGEALTMEQFAHLSNIIYNKINKIS